MKQIIVNIGSEYLTGAVVTSSNRGEKHTIERIFDIDLTDCYSQQGTLDMKTIATLVKENMKEFKHCDVTLILPSYVTNVTYNDVIANPNEEVKQAPGTNAASVVLVGENIQRKVNEIITYNSKLMESIVHEFYARNINVTQVLCPHTCYHNYIARFNKLDEFSKDPSANHIEMVWGAQGITYIVFTGNLPVATIPSEYNLLSSYRDLVSMGSKLPFSSMIKGFNLLFISAQSENGGLVLEHSGDVIHTKQKDEHLEVEEMDMLKNVCYSFITGLCQEIRSVYDHVVAEYKKQNVFLCSNSRLIDECLSHMIASDFPIEYIDDTQAFQVVKSEFAIKGVSEITDAMVPIIGAVIETIHKGVDFYAVQD